MPLEALEKRVAELERRSLELQRDIVELQSKCQDTRVHTDDLQRQMVALGKIAHGISKVWKGVSQP